MMDLTMFQIVANLGLDSLLNNGLKEVYLVVDVFFDLLVNLVVEGWKRSKECGLQLRNISKEIFARAEANSEGMNERIDQHDLLIDMAERYIAQVGIVTCEIEPKQIFAGLTRNEIYMGKHC